MTKEKLPRMMKEKLPKMTIKKEARDFPHLLKNFRTYQAVAERIVFRALNLLKKPFMPILL